MKNFAQAVFFRVIFFSTFFSNNFSTLTCADGKKKPFVQPVPGYAEQNPCCVNGRLVVFHPSLPPAVALQALPPGGRGRKAAAFHSLPIQQEIPPHTPRRLRSMSAGCYQARPWGPLPNIAPHAPSRPQAFPHVAPAAAPAAFAPRRHSVSAAPPAHVSPPQACPVSPPPPPARHFLPTPPRSPAAGPAMPAVRPQQPLIAAAPTLDPVALGLTGPGKLDVHAAAQTESGGDDETLGSSRPASPGPISLGAAVLPHATKDDVAVPPGAPIATESPKPPHDGLRTPLTVSHIRIPTVMTPPPDQSSPPERLLPAPIKQPPPEPSFSDISHRSTPESSTTASPSQFSASSATSRRPSSLSSSPSPASRSSRESDPEDDQAASQPFTAAQAPRQTPSGRLAPRSPAAAKSGATPGPTTTIPPSAQPVEPERFKLTWPQFKGFIGSSKNYYGSILVMLLGTALLIYQQQEQEEDPFEEPWAKKKKKKQQRFFKILSGLIVAAGAAGLIAYAFIDT